MRVSTKADYALRAMAQLAADATHGPVAANRVATEQGIPLKFLHGLLTELKRARLVRSTRGPEGGFELSRPAAEITLADVLRAVDGPLITVHDTSLSELRYPGPAHPLSDVWMAARTSLRHVFEQVTIADLTANHLPQPVADLATEYRQDTRYT